MCRAHRLPWEMEVIRSCRRERGSRWRFLLDLALTWASICVSDHQKLEREARICRLLKHPNIGKFLGHK